MTYHRFNPARSSTEPIMNTKQTTPVRQRQQVAMTTEPSHESVRRTLVLDIPGYYPMSPAVR